MQLRLEVIFDVQEPSSKTRKITLSQITTFVDIVDSRELNEKQYQVLEKLLAKLDLHEYVEEKFKIF